MFQPRVKLEVVRRYCSPRSGWCVFVDIDASEEGRTGGERTTHEALVRQREMQQDAERVRQSLSRMGVTVGGGRSKWFRRVGFPRLDGDRDIVAINAQRRMYLIAEVEGASSGQPEQKVYRAAGQLVVAVSAVLLDGWRRNLVLAVHGEEAAQHLRRVRGLEALGVAGLLVSKRPADDRWLFGRPVPTT